MTNTVRFSILGPVRAWRDGEELHVGSPQQRAVLAVLLLRERTMITVDELVAAVWGDDAPRGAIGTVRTYVHRLRRLLEADPARPVVLQSVGSSYTIAAGDLDLHEFQRAMGVAAALERAGRAAQAVEELDRALTRWPGAALTEVPGRYAETQRLRLAEIRLLAVEHRLELTVALGRHRAAVPELTALTTEHPYRERPRQLLMRALAGSGRRAEALAVYRDTRRLLSDELGIEPGQGLQRLHREILAAPTADAEGGPARPALRHVSRRQIRRHLAPA